MRLFLRPSYLRIGSSESPLGPVLFDMRQGSLPHVEAALVQRLEFHQAPHQAVHVCSWAPESSLCVGVARSLLRSRHTRRCWLIDCRVTCESSAVCLPQTRSVWSSPNEFLSSHFIHGSHRPEEGTRTIHRLLTVYVHAVSLNGAKSPEGFRFANKKIPAFDLRHD